MRCSAAARQLGVRSVLSASGHGNISIRRSGADEMLYTAVSNLRELTPAGIARIGLDGTLLAGTLSQLSAAAPGCTPRSTRHGPTSAAWCTPIRRSPPPTQSPAGRSVAGPSRCPSSGWQPGFRWFRTAFGARRPRWSRCARLPPSRTSGRYYSRITGCWPSPTPRPTLCTSAPWSRRPPSCGIYAAAWAARCWCRTARRPPATRSIPH